MKAELITGHKDVSPQGHITELRIWKLPEPVPPCEHRYKYRLAYVVCGKRVIGFDNERGKGDHCHIGGAERPYVFVGPDQLIEDFVEEVVKWQNAC